MDFNQVSTAVKKLPFNLFKLDFNQVSTAMGEFAAGESGCLPDSESPYRSQLLSPNSHRISEALLEEVFASTSQTSFWIGCDDADSDGIWMDK